MSFNRCMTSLSLNGKIPARELKDTAAEYQKQGMAPAAAMIRAVEERLEMAQMEERSIVKAVRDAYEAKGGKKKPARAKPKVKEEAAPVASPKVEAKAEPAPPADEAAPGAPAFSVTPHEAPTDAASAIERLMADKGGEAVVKTAAGDVTLVYGDDKAGLAHIAKRRGADFMKRLPELLEKGEVYKRGNQKTRVFIKNDTDEAVLSLDWNGEKKTWLLSAYEKYPDVTTVDKSRRSEVVEDSMPPGKFFTKDDLRKTLTSKGVLGQVIASMIDGGVVVLHGGPSKLPRGIGKNINGVQAVTTPDGKIHMVASNLTPRTALPVMLHEAFHQGGEKLIGTKEWGNLMGRLGSLYRQSENSKGKAREFFDRARVRVEAARKKGAVGRAMEVEEFAAYAIEEYEKAPDSLPAALRKWVEDLIGLVKTWMVKRFGKQLGDVTPAQLAAMARWAVMDVAVERRGEIFGPVGEMFSAGTDQTDTPAFKRWFGDSKVVDENGAPKIVYHGTKNPFSVFDHGRIKSINEGLGFYFTDNVNVADGYGTDGQTLNVYLSIQKPLAYDAKPFPKPVLKKILKRMADIEAEDTGMEIGDGFLSNFGDVRYDGLDKVLREAVENISNDDTAVDQLSGLWGGGVAAEHVLGAIRDVTGYDGIFANGFSNSGEGNNRIYVAWFPEQIKSAIGNNGDFDQNNADIRYSVSGSAEVEGLTPPEQGKLRKMQGQLQDNMNRVRQVQDRIETVLGAPLREANDYYAAETNRPGRIAARLEDVQTERWAPLMERLAKSGHTPEQLESLLHAMHAEERNEAVAKINDEMPDGGSGMTNDDAQAILKLHENDAELHAIAQLARDIARATLDLKLAYGLITADDYDTLANIYQNYVPLKGDGEYGPKIKRAAGHEERDEHILENIARDYDQAVVVGEKNLARQSLLRMVLQNPDPELWTVGVPPKGRYVGKVYSYTVKYHGSEVATFNSLPQVRAFLDGEMVRNAHRTNADYEVLTDGGEKVLEFAKPLQDNEVMVYVKGSPVRIQINDETLARQLRPLKQDQMGAVMEAFRGMNRYLSKIYTGYNPAFILKNAARDAMTGSINMVGHQGAATAAKAWTKYPAAVAALGKWAATGKIPPGEMGTLLAEYRAHGGKTGASYMSDLEQQGKTLERLFDDAYGARSYAADGRPLKAAQVAGRKIVGGMAHVVEVANQATENGLRLALYAQLREQGATPGAAARAAKTVTVDFDRKGTATGAMGAIYLFFNPAVQGAANAIKTLAQGEHKGQAWAALGGLALLGMYAASKGMDDDKDRWLGEGWDARAKNFMLNVGGKQLRIPLSQEFAPAYAMGVALAEAGRGESKAKSAVRMLSSFLDAYFPLKVFKEDSDNKMLDADIALTPTVGLPMMQSAVNRNTFGSHIVPESEFTKDRPDNLKMLRGTKNTAYDKAAQGIASMGEMLGAGKYENDISKVSPETLKMLWRTYTGGLGTFVTDTVGLASMAGAGSAQVETGDMPFVKDFVKTPDVKAIRGRYYELSKDAKAAITEFDQAKKAGDGEAMDKIMGDKAKAQVLGLGKMVTKVNKATAALRDEAVDVNADPKLTPAQKREQLKKLEKQEEEIYRSAIAAFK